MTSSDSEVLFPCPRCGNEAQLRRGQSVCRSQLRWYESVDCKQCGLRTEADGVGFPSDDVRERILSVSGRWKWVLADVKSIQAVSRVLREHLSLGTKEVLSVLRNSDKEVYRGTNAEALKKTLAVLAAKKPEVKEHPYFQAAVAFVTDKARTTQK
jgi:predicted RNA-binding Zn-ribbon protein involved in translation (DUF1610 family)